MPSGKIFLSTTFEVSAGLERGWDGGGWVWTAEGAMLTFK